MQDNSKSTNKLIYDRYSNLSNTVYEVLSSPNRNEISEKSIDSQYVSESQQNMDYSNYSFISNENDKSVNYQLNLDEVSPPQKRHDKSYASSIKQSQRSINLSNPALKVMNHSKFSSDVFKYLNAVRSNPSLYAAKLEKILREDVESDENGCVLYINNYPIRLTEGENAFREAIRFLKKQKPLPVLKTKEGMRKSAEDLVNIINLNDGKDDVISEKLAEVNFRMNKYGLALGELKEMIEYGTFDPEFVVLSLIICDGDPSRKERHIIFAGTSNYASIYSGLLPSDIIFTVINFAEQYFEQGAIIPEFIVEKYQINSKFIGKIDIPDMNAFKGSSNVPNTQTIRTNKYNESTFNTNTNKTGKEMKHENKEVSANIEVVFPGFGSDAIQNERPLVQLEGARKTMYGKAFTKDKNDDNLRETNEDFHARFPQYENKKEETATASKLPAKEKFMKPLESIKGGQSLKPQSALSMINRQFGTINLSQVNSKIRSTKQETPLVEKQRLNTNQANSKGFSSNYKQMYDSNPIVNLNINDEIDQTEINKINVTDSGKLITYDLAQAIMNNKYTTITADGTIIKQQFDSSRCYALGENNNNESNKNYPVKGVNSIYNTESNIPKFTQSSLKNTTYLNNPNSNTELSQTIRLNNPNTNNNTNNIDENPIKNTIYKSHPNANHFNSSNYQSLKLSNNNGNSQIAKENTDENTNVNGVLNKKKIITHEIRLSRDLDNLSSSFDLNKLKNFPDNVKTVKVVEKTLVTSKNSNLNDSEADSKVDDESEPYVKKKIVKKLIQFKDGSSEVVFYEK